MLKGWAKRLDAEATAFVRGIEPETQATSDRLDCRLEDLLLSLGPATGECCYQLGEIVALLGGSARPRDVELALRRLGWRKARIRPHDGRSAFSGWLSPAAWSMAEDVYQVNMVPA